MYGTIFDLQTHNGTSFWWRNSSQLAAKLKPPPACHSSCPCLLRWTPHQREFIVSLSHYFIEITCILLMNIEYCPTELQLVFHACTSQQHPDHKAPLLAHVLWYLPILAHHSRDTQMYCVTQEFDMHRHHKSGIIELSHIKGKCPLSPVFGETCDPEITSHIC